MAQGEIKKKSRPATAAKGKHQQTKGRVAKPQKPKKAKTTADKMRKKLTSGLVAQTEKMLGERAGHLELIGKGKKTDKADRVSGKGGSKKFG
jgi:hypothetical protein